MKLSQQRRRPPQQQAGMSLIELMIAMAVLAAGMIALLALFMAGTNSNNRNSRDSSATLLAQKILEQVSAQNPNSDATIEISDCTGQAWTIATADGPAPTGFGANLVTDPADPAYGGIDQTQKPFTITPNYSMQYVDCDTNGRQTTYDVRWNVMTVSANTTKLITVSARESAAPSNQLGGIRFAIPVTLRSIAGP